MYTKLNASRLGSGKSSTCCAVNIPPTDEVSNPSAVSAAARTSTTSLVDANCIGIFNFCRAPTSNRNPSIVTVRNPVRSAVI